MSLRVVDLCLAPSGEGFGFLSRACAEYEQLLTTFYRRCLSVCLQHCHSFTQPDFVMVVASSDFRYSL